MEIAIFIFPRCEIVDTILFLCLYSDEVLNGFSETEKDSELELKSSKDSSTFLSSRARFTCLMDKFSKNLVLNVLINKKRQLVCGFITANLKGRDSEW
jgi:hypothetical protein